MIVAGMAVVNMPPFSAPNLDQAIICRDPADTASAQISWHDGTSTGGGDIPGVGGSSWPDARDENCFPFGT